MAPATRPRPRWLTLALMLGGAAAGALAGALAGCALDLSDPTSPALRAPADLFQRHAGSLSPLVGAGVGLLLGAAVAGGRVGRFARSLLAGAAAGFLYGLLVSGRHGPGVASGLLAGTATGLLLEVRDALARVHGLTARQRRAALGGLGGLALAAVAASFGLHWAVYGLCHGEPFWRGMPASYYAAGIRASLEWAPIGGVRTRTPWPAEEWARRRLPAAVADTIWGTPQLFEGLPFNPSAFPMLAALTRDEDPRVRFSVACGLPFAVRSTAAFRRDARIVSVLLPLLSDPDPAVRLEAVRSITVGGPSARVAIPKLQELIDLDRGDPDTHRIALAARNSLRTISFFDPPKPVGP